jgi:hypothetical protein
MIPRFVPIENMPLVLDFNGTHITEQNYDDTSRDDAS